MGSPLDARKQQRQLSVKYSCWYESCDKNDLPAAHPCVDDKPCLLCISAKSRSKSRFPKVVYNQGISGKANILLNDSFFGSRCRLYGGSRGSRGYYLGYYYQIYYRTCYGGYYYEAITGSTPWRVACRSLETWNKKAVDIPVSMI